MPDRTEPARQCVAPRAGFLGVCFISLIGLISPLVCCAVAPSLDEAPAPALPQGLPPGATWPLVRHTQTLRALAIIPKTQSLAAHQRVCRRLSATLDVRYTNGGDARYHVNDKWIEPNDPPTEAELNAYCRTMILEALAVPGGAVPYDVIFADADGALLQDNDVQLALLECARRGSVVAVTGSFYPATNSVLAAFWPAAPLPRNSWMSGGAQHGADPELAGVPTEWLSGHAWIPLAAATNGGRALATGEAGALFAGRVGAGALLYSPAGLLSRRHDVFSTIVRQYDHDEIWLRAWDQAVHELLRGEHALPAYADLIVAGTNAPAGSALSLEAHIVNRSAPDRLLGSLHVASPAGEVVYRADLPLHIAPHGEQALALSVPVAADWPSGIYGIYLTLADGAAKQQFHQAMAQVPVAGSVTLQLHADRRGYRTGEDAHMTLGAASRVPWKGALRWGVYDFRGRLLQAAEQPTALDVTPSEHDFTWPVRDHGVRVDAFYVVAAAVSGTVTWARAELQVRREDPWSMRNEYQWSTWAGISCQSPSTVLPAMRLMAHAGMNALGYPGVSGLAYPAERWGWRYYNEGIGMNTFSPVIEYASDVEMETHLLEEAKGKERDPDLTSSAFVLGSVGEEAGYQSGWGRTYYWDAPVAPEKAARAFQWYLQTRYVDLARLNETWHTTFARWEDVQLSKEFSGQAPDLSTDGWAHPREAAAGGAADAVSLAPYADTASFYAWYYDRYVAAAMRILRRDINPVPLTMSSAPASWIFASRECDVRLAGPSCWNESQWHALQDGPEPAFGLVWGHFDWDVMTENVFWGFLLNRTAHNNYWVSVPLMFNNDMSHTRASMAMRRWTHRLAGHERIILDSRPAPADVGVLEDNGLTVHQEPGNMRTSLEVALMQGGFAFRAASATNLAGCRIVFAVARQAVTAADAGAIDAYAREGGTFVFTTRFANQDAYGAPQRASPGQGLSARWEFAVTNRQDAIARYAQSPPVTASLDGVADELRGTVLSSSGIWREGVAAPGWTPLAAYGDGVSAVLSRTYGKGRLVYVNAMYASHHYIQCVTPTDAARQGFFNLVVQLCGAAGAQRALRVDGDAMQTLHVAVKQFTDATGDIRYIIARTAGETPWTQGRLVWLGDGAGVYDVLNGLRLGREVPLNLRPGEGRLLAVLQRSLGVVRVTALRARLAPGDPLELLVRFASAQGIDIPGAFPVEIDVTGPAGVLPGLHRSLSLTNRSDCVIQTALSDPAGTWTVRCRDGITGVTGEVRVEVVRGAALTGPGFVSRGWPSEIAEPATMPTDEFLGRLRRLAALYRTDQQDQGWRIKQMLGAHYDFFPGTRHALLRALADVDWSSNVEAWRAALRKGDEFVLTGEDLGMDPATGLAADPQDDGGRFAAVASLLKRGAWRLGTADGDTLIATLGRGRVVLCRESVDAAGNTNAEVLRWQRRWLAELAHGDVGGATVPAMDEDRLRRWWGGEVPATVAPREVRWLGGNWREEELAMDPARPLDAVFALSLPPVGHVVKLDFAADVAAPVPVTLDLGCDDLVDASIQATAGTQHVAGAALAAWPDVLDAYLALREAQGGPARDGSGWRIVPVRARCASNAMLRISDVRLVVGP